MPGTTAVNTNMSLDSFQARHTSEDNASFLEIQKKDGQKHREKYSWVYQPNQSTLLLTDGTMMTPEQRLLMDKASASKSKRGDDRKGELDQWKYRISKHAPVRCCVFRH
jgi:protein DGCR14